eukprot:SAG11_NODE_27245_length_335_cov_0.610169_1_plen_37_part_10
MGSLMQALVTESSDLRLALSDNATTNIGEPDALKLRS